MIYADANGLFARVWNCFTDKFTVLDKDGEEILPVMVQSISPAQSDSDEETKGALIELLQGLRHNLEQGETVTLSEVVGMKLLAEGQ